VTFCLSKGLCAPVGSLLCGSTEFIARARRVRKSVGGGMRQAGILAAAGVVALEKMIDRLELDHRHACQLAEGLAEVPGISINVDKVKTNMVFFELTYEVPYSPDEIVRSMQQKANVWLGTNGPRGFRAVTHYWIGKAEVEVFLDVLRSAMVN
jgi:threonine aldolase